MRRNTLVVLFALLAVVDANDRHARLAKRQSVSSSSSSSFSSFSSSSSSGSSSASISSSSSNSTSAAATPFGTSIPPLSQITSGMPSPTTLPVTATYSAGTKPTISGAPPLPSPFVFIASEWPTQDQIAPTTGTEVAQWMTELDGFDIPDISPTKDGTCAGDPAAAAQAVSRGWWTCGGPTRDTDIVSCPNKMEWGVSFDDGPAFYTQQLLDYLSSKDLTATFFVVGSRVVEKPQVLIEEYMAGHEIAVHTWSHRPMTMLTNAQVVAELGYTRKAIKRVLGVTPILWRPPFGDIDDRVRAISLAMGLVPVIWTRMPSGATFDTNDWKVPGGVVNGTQSFATFQAILQNATTLNTGFVVLEHDLYAQTVDLAIGYTLPAAENFNPPITFNSVGHCNSIPPTNLYRETNLNTSFPYPNTTTSGNSSSTGSAAHASFAVVNAAISLPALIASLFALVVSMSLL